MPNYYETLKCPATLYKFRSFDSGNDHSRLLSHNELLFAAPVQVRFNDPFDSRIPWVFASDSREELVNYWTDGTELNDPSWTLSQRRAKIEELYDEEQFSESRIYEISKRAVETQASRIGVYSLAGSISSLLLWSHYADSRGGFAVGFHSSNLRKVCDNCLPSYQVPMLLLPVKYERDFPVINGYRDPKETKFLKQLLVKSVDRGYEREYRILLQEGPDRKVKFPKEVFRRVILGCNVTDQHRSLIVDILQARNDHLPLYQAGKSKNSFALTFTLVNY